MPALFAIKERSLHGPLQRPSCLLRRSQPRLSSDIYRRRRLGLEREDRARSMPLDPHLGTVRNDHRQIVDDLALRKE